MVRAPLRVCFPGGWIDDGESQSDAAIREMREELGATVLPLQCVWQHGFPERPLTLWGWLAELKSPTLTPEPKEVHEVLWLTTAEVVQHPDILPHTEAFIAALLKAL
jgi:8-oxo-dGTP pyrophosphatase MutT (NUDIX family)